MIGSKALRCFRRQSHYRAGGAHHHHEIGNLALLIEFHQVNAKQTLVANSGAEFQYITGFSAEMPQVCEILKNTEDSTQDCHHRDFATVGIEHRGIAEYNIFRQQRWQTISIQRGDNAVPLLESSLGGFAG